MVLTGVNSRDQTLPHANNSSLRHHTPDSDGAYQSSSSLSSLMNKTSLTPASVISSERKTCVYKYEDKYSFKRFSLPDSLVFDSHFESANLYSAYRYLPSESCGRSSESYRDIYELQMAQDVNTTGNTQWFFFKVSNTQPGKVLFKITNFFKPSSLYERGMKPLIYSSQTVLVEGVSRAPSWMRCGSDVSYTPNDSNIIAANNAAENEPENKEKWPSSGSNFYTLSFSHYFERSNEMVYFSFCHPFTYSDLQEYLLLITRKYAFVRRRRLCTTLAGNACDLLTITAPCASLAELRSRSVVIVMARVHPGETNSSWVMQGLLDFLVLDSIEAQGLRERYIFKIIPMLNPDGVINGNNRCDISGVDLNRAWDSPSKQLHPTIYYAKEMIKLAKSRYSIALALDLHGHSVKEGIFLFGCSPDKKMMLRASSASQQSPRGGELSEEQSVKPSSRREIFQWKINLFSR